MTHENEIDKDSLARVHRFFKPVAYNPNQDDKLHQALKRILELSTQTINQGNDILQNLSDIRKIARDAIKKAE